MSNIFDLADLLEKDEVEMIYRRELTEKEWDNIRFNLKSKYWSKVRKEMIASLQSNLDYFLRET